MSNFVSNENATTLFTKVKNNFGTQVIEWDDWRTMTKAEKEAIPEAKIINAPGVDDNSGHVNVFKKLWENPNPTAAFGAQNITLASDDYDFLQWTFSVRNSTEQDSLIIEKGKNAVLSSALTNSTNGTTNIARNITRVSDIVYEAKQGYIGRPGSADSVDNTICIPVAVYGFKKSIDVTAIISDVSTDARKCMLSDGVTSVETALGDTTSWTPLGTSVISCKYRKKNGVVFIRFSATNVTVSGSESIGTLPTGFRPLDRITLRNAFTGNNDATFYINTDGTVLCVSTSGGSGRYIEGIVSYPI